MSELVHEGTHVLDTRKAKNMFKQGKTNSKIYEKLGNSWSYEKRAYFHERAFQKATESSIDYEDIDDLLNQVVRYDLYSPRYY